MTKMLEVCLPRLFTTAVLGFAVACVSGCGGGGGGGSTPPPPPTFTVVGGMSGLTGTVVLGMSVSGGPLNTLSVAANGSFNFSQSLSSGQSYAVTVQTQPVTLSCTVTNGSGVVADANVTNVSVVCVPATFSVGGSVSGLTGTLVLAITAGGATGTPLTLATNGSFTFAQLIATGLPYAVSVQTQPAGQGCSVLGGSGVIGTANVTSVSVTCATTPAAPTISATPGNAQAALAWSAVSNATSYNVYTSATSPVTTASAKTVVNAAGTSLSALTNGTRVFAAVTAVGAGGESPLSNEVCAVPTVASNAGLTLYDPLCSDTLDGTKWQSPLFSRGVANGAMVLSAQASNMEPYNNRGLAYGTFAFVNASGQRVTTLQSSITVPAATAFRNGGGEVRASLRLAYQPPTRRLNFPAANSDLFSVQIGVRDDGGGLRAFREALQCDNASCTNMSSSGVTFVDPVGFSGETPASYDTTYVVTAAFNETSAVFSWSISGGTLNLSGTADAGGYLTTNPNWAALGPSPLANTGFLGAALRARVVDNAGGSSGAIIVHFDDVKVGINNAAAVPWDDFSGTGSNSRPEGLSSAKWTVAPVGTGSMTLSGGSLFGEANALTPNSSTLSIFNPIVFSDPTAIKTIQADFAVSNCTNSLSGTNRVGMAAAIYNDGTAGGTAPDNNQPNSRVGDITASLFIDCTLGDVRFQVTRFDTNTSQTILSNSANAVIPKGPASVLGNTHTLRMKWDPSARLLTFQADGQAAIVVDPTTINPRMLAAAPYVKPADTPNASLNWFLFFPNAVTGGAAARVDFKVNNVFTAP